MSTRKDRAGVPLLLPDFACVPQLFAFLAVSEARTLRPLFDLVNSARRRGSPPRDRTRLPKIVSALH